MPLIAPEQSLWLTNSDDAFSIANYKAAFYY